MAFSLLINRRLSCRSYVLHRFTAVFSLYLSPHNSNSPNFSFLSSPETEINPKSPPPTTATTSNQSKPTSLSARMSFVFDQIDAIEKERSQKDETLQRIRSWRESKNKQKSESDVNSAVSSSGSKEKMVEMKEREGGVTNKAVELVHPWPEWIELMERLVQQNYFDHKRKDEDKMIEDLGFKMEEVADEVFDFTQDWRTVQTACLNFGKDRFDILRSLSRQDIQVLVGHGCPSIDKKVVFSAKLLRKHAHLDEGDVCSSCNLRSSCERGYLLTNKEDEARTIDIMRVLLAYGFDPVNGSVMNESLLKLKSVKAVVRKLLHQVVKLSAVPIDPNLPPPVIKKPPPKVKQPPPPPRRRVGRDDIEMKKGDWLCPKCDFMNFAKNSVCLQCDSNRPKRQLLPGEWECPECDFLNYRRNVVCFHCECKRPPDEYMENKMQDKQSGPRTKLEKISARKDSWNFDFDDNESDGADVAAFEYADSHKMNEDFPESRWDEGQNSRRSEEGFRTSDRPTKAHEREFSDLGPKHSATGFDDFDDEEDDLESYEIDTQSRDQGQRTASIDFSELEVDSDTDDSKDTNDRWNSTKRSSSPRNNKAPKRVHGNAGFSGSDIDELDFDSDKDMPVHRNWKSSHVANPQQRFRGRAAKTFDSDDDVGLSSDSENDDDLWSKSKRGNKWDSNRKDVGRRAGHSSEDFSGLDSDGEDVRFHRDKGTKASFDRRRNVSKGRDSFDGSGRSGFKSRSMMDDRKSPSRDRFERSSGGSRSSGRGSGRDDYAGRRKGLGGDDYDGGRKRFGGDDYDGRRKSSGGSDSRNFKNPKQDSFGKQRGRFSNSGSRPTAGSDSFFEDERYNRPRNNVR